MGVKIGTVVHEVFSIPSTVDFPHGKDAPAPSQFGSPLLHIFQLP